MSTVRILPTVTFFLFVVACSQPPSADIVVIGKTWTANQEQPYAEGFAVSGDSIVAVGSASSVREWIGNQTEVIDAPQGALIVPGFIDSHVHFIDGGLALSSVQLRDAQTPEEFIRRIGDFAKTLEPGVWITSGDWDHENWGGQLPERGWIDSVTQDNPVWVNRLDGHMSFANTRALEEANVTENIKDIAGGTIVRDQRGRLTGIFKDNAMSVINRAVPPFSAEQQDQALEAAMAYVARHGVTSVHDMSGDLEIFERTHARNGLKTRIYSGMPLRKWEALAEKVGRDGRGDKWLRIGALKGFVDGSLGSRTAAFFEPFLNSPNDSGFFITEEAVLYRQIKSADSAGLHLMIHAIGDRAINTLLNIFDSVSHENGSKDRRFRIEHAQHIHPDDLARFGELNVIASMQPYHAIDDGRWAEQLIGHERSKTTYAFRSLLSEGVTLAFGSDWYVAPPTPLDGIYAAVTRRTLDNANPEGWVPEQKITVEEALRAYTLGAAFASFEEDLKGSIEVGKLADFVILGKDILSVTPETLRDVEIVMTVVGGNVVFDATTSNANAGVK